MVLVKGIIPTQKMSFVPNPKSHFPITSEKTHLKTSNSLVHTEILAICLKLLCFTPCAMSRIKMGFCFNKHTGFHVK